MFVENRENIRQNVLWQIPSNPEGKVNQMLQNECRYEKVETLYNTDFKVHTPLIPKPNKMRFKTLLTSDTHEN